jgi:Zn-dependent protease with chaperone function
VEPEVDARRLEPLSYHRESVAFLKKHEADLWRWMADGHLHAESEQLRKDLLRSTYRIDRDAHPEVYEAADRAARALELSVPVLLYQTQFESAPNAALVFVPHEAIVLFAGPLLELFNQDELAAVLGHELAHHRLWTLDGGDHLVADRLTNAAASHGASPAFAESARRLSLSTELFADRGGFLASGDVSATISALVKSSTGIRSVSATSYLMQAEEVVSRDHRLSEGTSHPETFIRAIAVRDWADGRDALSDEVDAILHGADDVNRLDLLGQHRVRSLTRTLIEQLLAPDWMQTDAMIGHARMFFPDIVPSVGVRDTSLVTPVVPSTIDYLAFVLLDFATADSDLEQQALVEAAAMAYRLGIGSTFGELLDRELKLKPKKRSTILADGEVRSVEQTAGVGGVRE